MREYIKEDGSIRKHIRTIGFSSNEQQLLRFEDFERMIGISTYEIDETINLKDIYGNDEGNFSFLKIRSN